MTSFFHFSSARAWRPSLGIVTALLCTLTLFSSYAQASPSKKKTPPAPAKKTTTTKKNSTPTQDPPRPTPPAETTPPRPPTPPKSTNWKVTQHRGQPYIALEDIAPFFGFTKTERSGQRLTLTKSQPPIEWILQLNSKQITLNKLRIYLSYPTAITREGQPSLSVFDLLNVIHPILHPEQRREPETLRTVIIDPARGGSDTGLSTKAAQEKNLTLDIALRLQPLLQRAGFQVVLTRATDQKVTIPERLALANQMPNDSLFLSLHGSTSQSEAGLETYTLAPSSTPNTHSDPAEKPDQKFYLGNIHDRESMALATALQGTLVTQLQAPDLGIKRARFEELRGIHMPGVVCRVGHLAHPTEGKKLQTEAYRQKIAIALLQGIQRYARVMAMGTQPAEADLRVAEVQIQPLNPTPEENLTQHLRFQATIARRQPEIVVDPAQVMLQIFFLDLVNQTEIDLSACLTPEVQWVSVLPDWKDAHYEVAQFDYKMPRLLGDQIATLGQRSYYGLVIRLVYGDHLIDEFATPYNLKHGLYHFTPLFPKRK